MKFTLKSVSKYVDIDTVSPAEVKDLVWRRLSEIEDVTDLSSIYKDILVAKVVSKKKHPESDKLFIAELDIGLEKPVQVVAGAGNFEVGDFVPYTPVGVKVPVNPYPEKFDGIIRARKLGGIISNGMMNSELELGLGDDHSKILILNKEDLGEDAKLVPGISLGELLELNDTVFEIENKSLTHRGDCFSTIGIARELSVIFNKPLNIPEKLVKETEGKLDVLDKYSLKIDITEPNLSPRYTGVVLNNITISNSPLWMRAFLLKHGIKSINNVVDITNYILILLGQPLHAFDYKRAFGETSQADIVVRRAKKGEKIVALDNKEYALDEDILVIANQKTPIAIAGVIGGLNSGITEDTNTVVIESANFNLYTIRRASMKLGLFTDAATVFSRAQDPNKTKIAILYAIELLQKYASAQLASKVSDVYPTVYKPKYVQVEVSRVQNIVDKKVTINEIKTILEKLGFEITNNDKKVLDILIPTYRPDVSIPEDIYEEIARIFGYENIQLTSPLRDISPVPTNKEHQFDLKLLDILTNKGLQEVINFAFISENLYRKCNLKIDDAFKIVNAVSKEVEYIRTLLIPELLETLSRNLQHTSQLGLVEIGKTFRKSYIYNDDIKEYPLYIAPKRFGHDEDGLPVEDKHIAGVITQDTDEPIYYVGRKYVKHLLQKLHIEPRLYHIDDLSNKAKEQLPTWILEAMPMYKKGRTAIITVNFEDKNIYLGILGEVSQRVLDAMGIKYPVVAFEMQMHILRELGDLRPRFVEGSKYPAVTQDLCFILDKDIPYEALIETILHVNKDMQQRGKEPLIQDIVPVDIYQSDVEDALKQITIRIVLQSYNKTLKNKDISVWRKKIIAKIKQKLNGRLKE